MTHIVKVEQNELQAIGAGKQAIIFRTEKPVTTGDKVVVQTDADEKTCTITDVHSSPGLMKHWVMVSFFTQVEPMLLINP